MLIVQDPTFKNCGALLPSNSILSGHGSQLAIRFATRPRLEGTVAMSANTCWITLFFSSATIPLRIECLIDTNISFAELQRFFWQTNPIRQDTAFEYAFFFPKN